MNAGKNATNNNTDITSMIMITSRIAIITY